MCLPRGPDAPCSRSHSHLRTSPWLSSLAARLRLRPAQMMQTTSSKTARATPPSTHPMSTPLLLLLLPEEGCGVGAGVLGAATTSGRT